MVRATGGGKGLGMEVPETTACVPFLNKCAKNHHGVKRRPPNVELADMDRQIRRLRSRIQSLTALFVVFLLGWFGWVKFTDLMTFRPRIHVDGGNIRFSMSNDGPYVITHVTASGDSGGDLRWAPLNPPMAVIDSHGADIDTSKLTWYDLWGKKADAPPKEAKFSLLYYQPDRVKPLETAEAP